MNYNGYEVIISNILCNRVQKRKHHKYRINKKWLKIYGYNLVSDGKIFMIEDKIIMAQDTWDKIKENIK